MGKPWSLLGRPLERILRRIRQMEKSEDVCAIVADPLAAASVAVVTGNIVRNGLAAPTVGKAGTAEVRIQFGRTCRQFDRFRAFTVGALTDSSSEFIGGVEQSFAILAGWRDHEHVRHRIILPRNSPILVEIAPWETNTAPFTKGCLHARR